MLNYQHPSPIHPNSLEKGSLDGKQLLRKQKRMEAQMEPSKTVGQYKVCKFMTTIAITNSVVSCTTQKNSSCIKPGTRRDPRRSRNQRCHLSTSPKLLLRNPQNHTQNTHIRLQKDCSPIPRRPTPLRHHHLRHLNPLLPRLRDPHHGRRHLRRLLHR